MLNNVPPLFLFAFFAVVYACIFDFFLSTPRYVRVLVGGITSLFLKLYPLFFEKLSPCIPPCALFVAVAVVAVCCWVGDNGGNVYYLPCPPPCSNNKTSFHISLVNAHVHPPPP